MPISKAIGAEERKGSGLRNYFELRISCGGVPKCLLGFTNTPTTKLAITMRSTALAVVLLLTNFPWIVQGQGTLRNTSSSTISSGSSLYVLC